MPRSPRFPSRISIAILAFAVLRLTFFNGDSHLKSRRLSSVIQFRDPSTALANKTQLIALRLLETRSDSQVVGGIQDDGTYLLIFHKLTGEGFNHNCNDLIHQKDQIKLIHFHHTSCNAFDHMFGNRLANLYGIKMIANALRKPFTFTCGLAEGDGLNGAAYLMNLNSDIPGPVPTRSGDECPAEECSAEDICRLSGGMYCMFHSSKLYLASDAMISDWRHLTSSELLPGFTDIDDAVIHLRLGDGLYNQWGRNQYKGIFPHATYINLLEQAQQEKGTINTIGIVTAPFKGSYVRGLDQQMASMSEAIAIDLVYDLQHAFPQAMIRIHNRPDQTIMESLARVVLAHKVAVCGCSTFCPYPLLATKGIGFMYNPVGYENNWVQDATHRYENIRLFDTPMLNGIMIDNKKTGWKLNLGQVLDWVRNQDREVGNVDISEEPVFREIVQ